MTTETATTFNDLALNPAILAALKTVGYETPSPIQQQTIPLLLQGRDVVGQAQTGTGKTAAFALPTLSRVDLSRRQTQVLVLAPTRELAIQVAEAFQKYAAQMPEFHVLPIYGGQEYRSQLRGLERGAHVVVGTPGRVMDHMRRGSLKLDNLSTLVLDEADEMLRMGFIDDVEWILQQTPPTRQIALFSATMPQQIKRIASQHLREPAEITIKVKTATAETIRQRYWLVSGVHKLDALTRILEAEDFDGMIIFVRTKLETAELAEKLEARGYAAAALSGDVVQKQRERTIEQLKGGKLDIIVATDVAARGLDVERISHVVNYDIPHDTESYVHRIGRTGRAGRHGEAILFVAPRERRMLQLIERATRKPIEPMDLPSAEIINDKRVARFMQTITDTLAQEDLSAFAQMIEQYQQAHNVPAVDIAAALARLLQGDKPLFIESKPVPVATTFAANREPREARVPRERSTRAEPADRHDADTRPPRPRKTPGALKSPEAGMQRYRVEVGHLHQLKPGNLVGAIANEAGLDSQYIGRIEIYDDHSLVDLPEGMPKNILRHLQKTWVAGRQLNIALADGAGETGSPESREHSGEKPSAPRFGSPKPAGKGGFKPGAKASAKAGFKPGFKAGDKSAAHKPAHKPGKKKFTPH